MARDLPSRLARQLRREPLWEDGCRLLVATSGGADSTALISMLSRLDIDVVACFVDHGNRDVSAEIEFLLSLCQRLGVPFVHRHTTANRTDEAALRRVRYRTLAQVASDHGLRYVATAHTADDQLETVLMRIVRGCSIRGLIGIPAKRRLPSEADPDVPRYVVRPLLGFRRDEVRGWLLGQGTAFVEDPTNRDSRYLRNRLRTEIVPKLYQVNPKLAEAVSRLARSAADLCDLLEFDVRRASKRPLCPTPDAPFRLDATYLASLPIAVRLELILRFARTLPDRRGEITRTHVESVARLLDTRRQRQVSLPGGLCVRRRGRWLEFVDGNPGNAESPGMVAETSFE